jgi:hypothetical protein
MERKCQYESKSELSVIPQRETREIFLRSDTNQTEMAWPWLILAGAIVALGLLALHSIDHCRANC